MGLISDFITNVTAFRVKIGEKLLTLASRIGLLSSLTTVAKTDVVAAINEVNAGLGTVNGWGRGLRVDGNAVVINNPLANQSAYSVKNASMWAGTTVTDKFLNSNSGVINFSALPGYSLSLSYRNGRMGFATEEGSVFSGWFEFWHSGNFNPAQYATLAGVQTFTNTNTFAQAPIVPTGTLNGHAVNLGQLVNYFKYVRGLTAADHLDTIMDQGIFQQTTSANATIANGYPVNNLAGVLEVYKTGSSHLRQIYTPFSPTSGSATGNRSYQRYYFNGVWSTWRQVAYAGDGLSSFVNDAGYVTATQLNNKADINGANTVGGSWKIDYVLSDILTSAIGNGQVIGVFSNGTVDYGSDALNGHRFRVKTSTGLKVYVSGLGEGQVWHQFNFNPSDYATKTFVNTAISNLKFVSRMYDAADVNNNDRYIGANILSTRNVEGFDVCVYNTGDNGFITPFAGGSNLHNAFMGILGIQVGSDVVIKGAVQSPNDLSSYIGADQIYFCLAYVFAPGGVSGVIQFMSTGDIYNHKANATGSEIKDVIIIGEIGAPNILLLNQREI